ncbi:hypothetical protein [Leptolyngbya sp. O-77]|uniref:hypothetical protein n=1 Tax=Leptolyngbya sp. O-77 TaxID=1080068 RepID=UPI00074D38AE|nr:hypothetical protein [Leptolyngbya sp. O-77]BAU44440.1 hypothetical protein O77CONTIG1_04279 [Leptolyngbya sp. O-77]
MSNFSEMEMKAGTLFYQGKKAKLDYEGYCDVVKKTGDLYLQLLADYLERVPNEEISTRAIAIGNLMVEVQGIL